MATFTYYGETSSGESVTQKVVADDRYAVYDIARTNGHSVMRIEEDRRLSFAHWINVEKINSFLSRVSGDELVMSTRNLSSMLVAGLPLSRALSVMERQSKNPRLKGVLRDVREHISKGDPFHESLKLHPKVFSKLYVAMVRAGEESGTLAPALKAISTQLERLTNLKKKIKGAMIYPAIVISVMVIIGILMMIYVMPTLTSTFTQLNIDLPTTTKILIGVSTILLNHGLIVLLVFIFVIAMTIAFSRTESGKRVFHWIFIHLPVIGNMVKETNSAYTSRTLSSLLSSGVDVIGAIGITEEVVQNVYYKDILRGAAERVEKGKPLSEAFIEREDLYPILVGEMVSVGEETGQIAQMLTEIATFYEGEVEMKTKDLSTIIEPILMVVIGATVGFFALAMIAPIYSITDGI